MLKEKLADYRIILASGSPRRQQFLVELDIPFEVKLKPTKEEYPQNLKGGEITAYLAQLKANAFANELQSNDMIITSDTIVWLNNEALGKPTSANDANKMLQKLSGKKHQVFTSVCIKTINFTKTITDVTDVYFSELNASIIEHYIDQFKPFDKAGSYGIQDWIGHVAIKKIEGSYTNVMGLPTEKLFKELMSL